MSRPSQKECILSIQSVIIILSVADAVVVTIIIQGKGRTC